MVQLLVVGLGGFIGAVFRYWLSGVAERWVGDTLPLGTLLVNVLGCLALGAVMCLVEYRQWFGPNARVFLTIGILGGLTTFSAFGYETFALARDGQLWAALANVAANVVLGTAAVTLGWLAAKSTGI
jgi:CrcB protein